MFAPGIIGFVVGAFILLAVKDTPQSAGYLPVEVPKDTPAKGAEEGKKESLVSLLVNDCLK
jgi:OPA family sugar phosphate sensor protein UhpC-like MFS transporter